MSCPARDSQSKLVRPDQGEAFVISDAAEVEPVSGTAEPARASGAGEPTAYVYVLHCADDTYYTGWTTDLEKRLQAHNGELPGGAKYTSGRRPVRLIWYCPFSGEDSKVKAQQLEYRLKKLSRQAKIKYMDKHPQSVE